MSATSRNIIETLRAQAKVAREELTKLEAQLDALERLGASQNDNCLSLRALATEFGFTRASLTSAQANGLPVFRGPKGRLTCFRSDVEAWIRSRAWSAGTRRVNEADDDALARAERELVAMNNGVATRQTQPFSASKQ